MTDPFDVFEPFGGGARGTDPDTSWGAAYRDLVRRAGDRLVALEVHASRPNGLTDYELAALMARQQNSAGKRRGELRDYGLIEATAIRRAAPSKSPCIVWAITEMGKQMLLAINRRKTLP
jgi:hypothetical protein